MFKELLEINRRPRPYEFYTAADLWTDEHTSMKMLEYHLNPSIDAASRNFEFIDRSVKWMIDHFNLGAGSRVVDFGCGPGLYTTRIAKSGAAIMGIDFSERSLEHARKEASANSLEIDYIHSNYLEYETDEKYDLIMMIMCDFTALSPLQRDGLLAKFRSMLAPGGSVLLDVYSLHFYDSIREQAAYEFNQMNSFWSADDYYCFMNTFKYDDEKLVLDKYTIYGKHNRKVIYNWYQCFSVESIRKQFDRNGLEVIELYSDVAGSEFNVHTNEFAVVARAM